MKPITLFIAVVLLAGCAATRQYIPPDTSVLEKEPIGETGLDRVGSAEPAVDWWTAFEDEQLNRYIETALQQNHDVRIAIANVMRARAILRQTGYDRTPTVESDGLLSYQVRSDEGVTGGFGDRDFELYEAGVNGFWEMDLFGRVSQRIAAAGANYEASIAELNFIYVGVAAETARAYTAVRGAQLRLEVAMRNEENQKQTYELTQTLAKGGRSNDLDVARAHAQLELTRSTIPPLEAELRASVNRLGVLTGNLPSYLREELHERKPLPAIPENVPVGDASQLIRRRPDIHRSERLLAASVAQYNVAAADLYPRVTLLGSLGFQATDFTDLFSGDAFFSNIGPGIHWAAFDLGRVRAMISASDAETIANVAAHEKTVLQALEEIDTAITTFSREENRRNHLILAAQSSAEAAQLARKRFEAGIDSFLNVLDAESRLLEAEDRLAQSEIFTAIDLIGIYQALGGGWQNTSVSITQQDS